MTQIRKLLFALKHIFGRRRVMRRTRRTLRRSLAAGTALAVCAPLVVQMPAEAAHILVKEGMRGGVIAVDPSVIPLGTHVFIPGYGEAVAEDIGYAINGYRIDVAFDTHAEALSFGRRDLEIFIME